MKLTYSLSMLNISDVYYMDYLNAFLKDIIMGGFE